MYPRLRSYGQRKRWPERHSLTWLVLPPVCTQSPLAAFDAVFYCFSFAFQHPYPCVEAARAAVGHAEERDDRPQVQRLLIRRWIVLLVTQDVYAYKCWSRRSRFPSCFCALMKSCILIGPAVSSFLPSVLYRLCDITPPLTLSLLIPGFPPVRGRSTQPNGF